MNYKDKGFHLSNIYFDKKTLQYFHRIVGKQSVIIANYKTNQELKQFKSNLEQRISSQQNQNCTCRQLELPNKLCARKQLYLRI